MQSDCVRRENSYLNEDSNLELAEFGVSSAAWPTIWNGRRTRDLMDCQAGQVTFEESKTKVSILILRAPSCTRSV